MNTATHKTLNNLISVSFAQKLPQEYHNKKIESTAKRLIALAETCDLANDCRALLDVSARLNQLSGVALDYGLYYQTVARKRLRQTQNARLVFEALLSTTQEDYLKARILLSLGAINFVAADYEPARDFYCEAIQAAGPMDYRVRAQAIRMQAAILDQTSDSAFALALISRAAPFIGSWRLMPEYLNSKALILSHLGQHKLALELARTAAASPLSKYHPEFQETVREIQREIRRPEIISVSAPSNVIDFAEAKARIVMPSRDERVTGTLMMLFDKRETVSHHTLDVIQNALRSPQLRRMP